VTPAAYPRVLVCDGLRRRKRSVFSSKTRSASRAGSPLLFGLAPRGVFRASGITTGAVGSYPTFSPLPNVACILASLRFPCATATVLRSAGGLFSVALSVNSSTGFSLCSSFSRTMNRAAFSVFVVAGL